jgi:hypothetical protein
MANSLMELYGGGMAGKPTNYQIGGGSTQPIDKYPIGGYVSQAKIRSKYLSDYNKVKDAYDENIKNMGFWSNVGSIGGFLADLVVPGSGGIVKAGVEGMYRPQDIGDVDFALGEKEQAQEISDAYRKGILERGLASSLSSLMMSDIYKDMGEKVKTGYEEIPQRVTDWGADKPMYLGEEGARRFGIGGDEYAKTIMERSRNIDYQPGDFDPFDVDAWSSWDGYQKRGGQIPQMQGGGPTDLTPDLSNTDWNALQGFQVFGSGNPLFGKDTDWSGLPIEGMPRDTTTTTTKTPGSAGTFSPYGDYGKQRSVEGALIAAGMGDKMKDPEFEKYMKYFPTFDMGYEQKIADYRTGAQGSLFGMTAPMGAGETTFSGSGAVKKARETGRKQTTDIYGRQERGVGEEYIKDVLAALTAAETAKNGAFEAPEAGDKVDPPEDPAQTQYEQWKTHNGRKWKWDVNNKWWEDMGPA